MRLMHAVFLTSAAATSVLGQGYRMPVNIPATSAAIAPQAVAADANGDIFFSDQGTSTVIRLNAATGTLTPVAGNGTLGHSGDNGPATGAQLNLPIGVAVDSAGNIYIAEFGNARVRKVSNGVITTVAGNGIVGYSGDNFLATDAKLGLPTSVAVDAAGNLYISDNFCGCIRKVSNGVITPSRETEPTASAAITAPPPAPSWGHEWRCPGFRRKPLYR